MEETSRSKREAKAETKRIKRKRKSGNVRKMDMKDLVVGKWSKKEKYIDISAEKRIAPQWGQLKLFTWILQFLTIYWNPKEVPNPIVVYAGAAPGYNISVLSKLFPNVVWHLYDPNKIEIKPSKKIRIYRQLFQEEDARKWANRKDVFLVSDIRTAPDKLDERGNKIFVPTDDNIRDDLELQRNWYNIIKPVKCTLKFRFFSRDSGIDQYDYLPGVVFMKIFRPRASTESGLVPEGHFNKTWNTKDYIEIMNWNNQNDRIDGKYANIFTDTYEPLYGKDLTSDWDTTAFAMVLSDYMYKITGSRSKDDVIELFKFIISNLSPTRANAEGIIQSKRMTKLIGPEPPKRKKVKKRKLQWRNPKMRIINFEYEGKNLYLIQEGSLEGGIKERGLIPFVASTSYDEYVYVGSSDGCGQVAIAKACNLASRKGGKGSKTIRCTIFVDKPEKETNQMKAASDYGAKHVLSRKEADIREITAKAEEYTKGRNNARLIPYSADESNIYELMTDNIESALNKSLKKIGVDKISRMWMVTSTGSVLSSFASILKDTHFMVVQNQPLPSGVISKKRSTKFMTSEMGVSRFEPTPKEDMPPYDSIPSYDAKLWHFLKDKVEDGDFILNVASEPNTARKTYLGNKRKKETIN